ncbi:acyl-CoA dehydrogenase NM domain-like protein [Cucurbitaria berberidis CBS 394.84]|uniref:DASH complex subunit SPC34 n=1 Tax=Cucurbitaria berberidis CBS 394.84 TaxID=1168544 RepID=A0A9P4LAB5_9PLEO|nr:acyl-CoA dehydrogenase NM domain-like protein [Cucurbitaria berberidis CBS 394.84]KAF1848211.1 acyl-CoA dehydrogenase NM domain-like protein [Cucurbitaria berberidis CBS 394.84]
MTLLDAHLEQISLCATSIAELPYRALFSVPPPPAPPKHAEPSVSTNRRNTIFNPNGGGASISGGGANAVRAPRRNTAVAAVLGNELVERIRRGGGGGAGSGLGYRTYDGNNKNEVDVEPLLEGAEKLLGVYPIPGAHDKIATMRQRHAQVTASIDYYESRLAEQQIQLTRLNRSRETMHDDADDAEEEPQSLVPMTEEDLRREEEEMRQLERKKRELEDRQKALRTNARAFAQHVLSTAPNLYAHLSTQTERFQSTLPVYQAATSAGLIKGQVPTPLGGTSSGLVDAAIVIEEFHAVEPSTALTILGTGLGLTPLILAGSKEQHEKFLTPFLKQEGERLASFVHSEPGGTANWLEKGGKGLTTTAWQDGDRWVLDGEKLWATNSGGWDNRGADLQCIVCRESKPNAPQDTNSDPTSSILVLLVTRDDIAANDSSAYQVLSDPELSGHKSANGPHSRFTNFRVSASNLLAAPGQGAQIVEKTFGMSAAIVGAMCVGVMRHAFEAALSFCKNDDRGGAVPIIKHQAVADRLIDVKCKIEAARALTWKAMSVFESTDDSISWEQRLELALEAKIWCSDQAPRVVLQCMDVVGMKSYAKDMPFSKLLEDAACLPLFDGGNVGVRRRQLEKILQREDYEPWVATYPS